jgi:hypothetical protein
LDFLLEQPGVNVFSTNDSYFGGRAGMVWINFLKNRYSDKGWSLYVDVDEALVYDGCATRSIPDLVELLESEGSQALPSFMLDMFNLDQTASTDSSEDINYVTRYPFYLPKFHRNPKAGSPYSAIRGGVRTAFGTGEELTKTPLVKSASGIEFLLSSHHISPAKISSYSSVLLHYKMIDGLVEEAKAALAEQKRSPHCLNRYRRYLEAKNIADLIGESLENVKRYEGYEELIDLGLISRIPGRARSANV